MFAQKQLSMAALCVAIAISSSSCAAARTVAGDLLRSSGRAVEANGTVIAGTGSADRAALESIMAKYLRSSEWQNLKEEANQAFKLSRQDPVCSTAIDLVADEDARSLGGLFDSVAEAVQGMNEAASVRADAERIGAWLDEGGAGADSKAQQALVIAGFQTIYCE